MDIVEFIENVYECHLLNSQKDYIRKIYDSIKKNNRIFIYRPSRGCAKVAGTKLLFAIIFYIDWERKGYLEEMETIKENFKSSNTGRK